MPRPPTPAITQTAISRYYKVRKNRQTGFTLLELMVVLSIIAILAAVGFPAYQDYATRAKMTEALSVLQGFKTKVTEYYILREAWPRNHKDLGYSSKGAIPVSNSKYVSALSCQAGIDCSQIAAQLNLTAVGITGATSSWGLFLIAEVNDEYINWTCSPGARGETSPRIPIKYLPGSCRELVPAP